jgi:hypothetical protein
MRKKSRRRRAVSREISRFDGCAERFASTHESIAALRAIVALRVADERHAPWRTSNGVVRAEQ